MAELKKTIQLDMPGPALLRAANFLRGLANDSPLSDQANEDLRAVAEDICQARDSLESRIESLRAGESASEALHRSWHDRALEAEKSMTAEQQIRAKALESVCRLYADSPREVGIDPERFMEKFERVFWEDVRRFERYIKEGK